MVEQTFLLKMSEGADVFEELEKLARASKIDYAFIVSGYGRIKDFELISHESKGGISRAKFGSEFEVNAMSGKVQLLKGGKFAASLRVSVSSTGFTSKAGQIVAGKAGKSLEIGLRKVDFSRIIEA